MTVPESNYEMDHVREIYENFTQSETLRNRYLKSWERWLVWCQEHDLKPGAATRSDLEQFIYQLPSHAQAYIQGDISTTYFKLGGSNPARRLRPITANGRDRHQRYWSRWVSHCERASVSPLPADPEKLAEYLWQIATKVSRRNSERTLSAISRIHSESDLPDPKRAEPVSQVLAEIKTIAHHTNKPRQKHSAQSPNTIRRDQGIWKRWSKWCSHQEVDPITATPEDVVTFLTQRRLKPCTYGYIRVLYHSLRTRYQSLDLGHNPVDSEVVPAHVETGPLPTRRQPSSSIRASG